MKEDSREITLTVHRRSETAGQIFSAEVSELVLRSLGRQVFDKVVEGITKTITDQWIADNGGEVLKSISPEAVAQVIKDKMTQKLAESLLGRKD